MFKQIGKSAMGVGFGLTLASIAACQVPPPWISREIYSNADGTVQFMVIEITHFGLPPLPLVGQTLVTSDGSTQHTFTFTRDMPYTDGGSYIGEFFLVGTQRFADFSVVKPDFVVPDGFFFVRSGSLADAKSDDAVLLYVTIKLGESEVRYQTLPTNGLDALVTASLSFMSDSGDYIDKAVAINRSGQSSVFASATGVDTVVEYVTYVNYPLLDYFLTAYPSEINALRAGGWFRTGFSFIAWIDPVAEGVNPPRDLSPACRVYLGNTHFYSTSTTECAGAAQYPGSFLETPEAFFATLPDAATGSCPADQTPLYRLWNPRGAEHRYTTSTVVRDEMLARGYLAEGSGPGSVTMCVGGGG